SASNSPSSIRKLTSRSAVTPPGNVLPTFSSATWAIPPASVDGCKIAPAPGASKGDKPENGKSERIATILSINPSVRKEDDRRMMHIRFRMGMMLALVWPSLLPAQEKTAVPPGTPVNITVQPAAPTAPPISIVLGSRHGHVMPERH